MNEEKIFLPIYKIAIESRNMGGSITSELDEKCDPILSLVLAHAVAGVDISSPAYLEGIETAVEAIYNNLEK